MAPRPRLISCGILFLFEALTTTAALAVELDNIERKIAKEPAYATKDVRYALLVFGPDAESRVWLALDGPTLYVDRNANGDLTDEGECIEYQKESSNPSDGTYAFVVNEIRVGERVHKNLTIATMKLNGLAHEPAVKELLARDPKAVGYFVLGEIDLPPWKGGGVGGRVRQHASTRDALGVLQFTRKPDEAPILHFGGPWQIALFGAQSLLVGREGDLVLGVGTPGVGPGSTVWVDYQGVIPETVFPLATIKYPPQSSGAPPIEEHYELKHRC